MNGGQERNQVRLEMKTARMNEGIEREDRGRMARMKIESSSFEIKTGQNH